MISEMKHGITVSELETEITVILVSYKRPDNIKLIVDALMKQTIKPTIFLWNNNSEIQMKDKRIKWIVNSNQNVGAYGRFHLVPTVGTEYVMTFDDDVGIAPDKNDFIEQAINLVKEHPTGIIGAFGKRIVPGVYPYNGAEIRTDYADIVKAKFMCMRTEILKNVPLGTPGGVREDDIYISYYAANGKKNAHFISWALRESTIVLPEGDCGNDKNPKHMNSRNDFINLLIKKSGELK